MDLQGLAADAYLQLLRALEASGKLGWESEELLMEARELLQIPEMKQVELLNQVENDPVLTALKNGELPTGMAGGGAGLRGTGSTVMGGRPSMPLSASHGPAGYGAQHAQHAADMYEAPGYGGPSGATAPGTVPSKPITKKPTAKKAAAPAVPPPVAVPMDPAVAVQQGGYAVVGWRFRRFAPDVAGQWLEGTVAGYDPATDYHTIQYTKPSAYVVTDTRLRDIPQDNYKLEPPSATPPPPAAKGGSRAGQAGGGSGGGSKSKKKTTPLAAPASVPTTPSGVSAPALGKGAQAAAAVIPHAPALHAVAGGGPAAAKKAPFVDAYVKSMTARGKMEDFDKMAGEISARESEVADGLIHFAAAEDPAGAGEVQRLLQERIEVEKRISEVKYDLLQAGLTV